tara:strand:+ start:610 stop:1191 length:582 start_codon:yes stop_codon:yes gene_type:complete
MNIIKNRKQLPSFIKIEKNIDVNKLLNCFKTFVHSQDNISTTCGTPYLSDNYLQMTLTSTVENMKYVRGKEDERCYGKLNEEYQGTYVEDILNTFKSKYTRVRIIKKKPGSYILPHIDYDTTYSVRYYIPLQTNPWAMTAVQNNEVIDVMNLEADGSMYFVNPGLPHSAWNFGKEDDIRMVVSVNGQDDLPNI